MGESGVGHPVGPDRDNEFSVGHCECEMTDGHRGGHVQEGVGCQRKIWAQNGDLAAISMEEVEEEKNEKGALSRGKKSLRSRQGGAVRLGGTVTRCHWAVAIIHFPSEVLVAVTYTHHI